MRWGNPTNWERRPPRSRSASAPACIRSMVRMPKRCSATPMARCTAQSGEAASHEPVATAGKCRATAQFPENRIGSSQVDARVWHAVDGLLRVQAFVKLVADALEFRRHEIELGKRFVR